MKTIERTRALHPSAGARAVLLVLLAAPVAIVEARADRLDQEAKFEIPAQRVATALVKFSRQANVQVVTASGDLGTRDTRGVFGRKTGRAALEVLLERTGLEYSVVGENTVVIRQPDVVSSRAGSGSAPVDVLMASNQMQPLLAFAAEEPAPPAGGGGSSAASNGETRAAAVEEIIVTARRREERLQDTPIAVSAFSAATLERQQIYSTDDLDQVTPSLQFTGYGPLTGNNSAAQVFIRGIGQTDASSGVDPGVGLYIDDVYMGRAVGGVMDFRDIANIQVLRGPQGTLFGRNTIGGAVLITTEQPGDAFGGTLRVGVGDDSLWEAFGAVDIPLGDRLAMRASVGARQRDGYVTRVADGIDLGDENSYTLQSSLRWRASDTFTLTVRADYTEEDENGSPFVFAAINENQAFPAAVSVGAGCPGATFPPPAVPQGVVDARCANDATWLLGPFNNGGTAPAESTLENWGVSAVMNWNAGEVLAFKSITAYRELSWSGLRDADNTPFTILHTDYASDGDQFSQELQALVDAGPLNGVFGAFYFQENVEDLLQVPFAAPPPRVAAGGPGNRDYQYAEVDNDNLALFTQWTYDLTSALSLTAGVRYTEETKGIRIIGFTIDPGTAPTPDPLPSTAPPLNVLPTPFEKTFSSTTGSASVQYRWNEQVMTYLSWSQGFKSGGYNQRFNAPPPGFIPFGFDEEEAETFELGFKTDFGGVFRLNGAIFSTDYDNMQLIYRVGIVPILFNAGKSSIDGAELELTWSPLDALTIDASVGYLDDSIDEIAIIAIPGQAVTATVGPDNTLPFTPEWKGNVGIAYSFDLAGGDLILTPRVNVSYTAEQFFDAANSREVAQLDDVMLLNASVALQGSGGWRVTAGVNNATDELYPAAGNSSFSTASGYAEIIYARPRNYFLNLSYDF